VDCVGCLGVDVLGLMSWFRRLCWVLCWSHVGFRVGVLWVFVLELCWAFVLEFWGWATDLRTMS